ncbi:hypothetical protein DVH24_016058 [Malus domestica]|uniref:Disease resistance N-terminal domain-containing protein n=1 Tax=Malus domestica TaxID=3750 RepID=A0A498JKZ4_MALDO|nr:hypothetical protein DVH24_016058 [Malus domestica]
MAEGVLFNIAEGIIKRLGSLAFQEIGLIWGVQDEFQKLKETVAGFQAILLDAEQKQANNEVKLWLQSVEDVVYEVDDVLDEFNTKAQQRQMVPENTKVSKKGWWRAHTHNSASSSSSTENLSLPSFPSLSTLDIFYCPNLTSIPLCPNVETIQLYKSSWKVVDSLFVRGASDITHDVGVDVSASSSSPHLSKLTRLELTGIEDLASLPEEISNLTSLQLINIDECSNLTSLPEGIRGLPCLNTLNICGCPMLSERCKKETGEDWPKIAHIPHIIHTMWVKDFAVGTFAFPPTIFNFFFLFNFLLFNYMGRPTF